MAAPGVTLTANLKLVIDGVEADQAQLQITLCGFGAMIPSVPGEGLLADAGIPKTVIQSGGTTISVELYNNQVIQPPGTFYCIVVLDSEDNAIQANDYAFDVDGTYDLSVIQPIVAGVPSVFNEAAQRLSPTQYKVSKQPIGAMLGVYYNGSFQQPGPGAGAGYNMNGQLINFTFPTLPSDTVNAVFLAIGNSGVIMPAGKTVDTLPITSNGQTAFILSKTPAGGVLIGLYYNGQFQGDSLYTLAAMNLNLTFSTYLGDSLYAVYIGT